MSAQTNYYVYYWIKEKKISLDNFKLAFISKLKKHTMVHQHVLTKKSADFLFSVFLHYEESDNCGSVSNPFGGGVFIWIVNVVMTELFSHFGGDVFNRIVGVVVVLIFCDCICYFMHIDIALY